MASRSVWWSCALRRRRFAATLAAIAAGPMLVFGAHSSAQTGEQLFKSVCSGCHDDLAHPKALVYNAAGNAAVLQAVIARGMPATSSLADLSSIATYLDSVKPTVTLAPVAANPIATKLSLFDVIVQASDLHADWKIISRVESVTPPKKGTVTYKGANGPSRPTFATYTPFPGQSGIDTWTYRGIGPDEATSTTIRTASVIIAGGGSPNYQGLWWNAPANSEPGWGVNLAHQGDTIFASWFTYDPKGRAWWLVMAASKTAPDTFEGDLLETHGPAFDSGAFTPVDVPSTPIGKGKLVFTDANNGTFSYTVSKGGLVTQSKSITRQQFGPLPTCTFGEQPDLALATNYQDLWWKSPAGSEKGWGINLNHQGNTIFATWFTYDHDGTPLWLVVSADKQPSGVYTGDLFRTTGPPFNAMPWGPFDPKSVGSATFTFVDGNNASFDYTVKLDDMASPVRQVKAITRQVFTAPGTACQ